VQVQWPDDDKLTRYGTPWRDGQNTRPIYVAAHANSRDFAITVNTRNGPVKLRIDGRTLGRLAERHRYFRAAAGLGDDRPIVIIGCQSGRPDGTSGQGFAQYLGSLPGFRNRYVYGPTGRLMIQAWYTQARWAVEENDRAPQGYFRRLWPPFTQPIQSQQGNR
jgi:hypothetical protein